MFSITVEEVFQVSSRRGTILVGRTVGVVSIGDYLVDIFIKSRRYRVIGFEMLHYTSEERNSTHNPAILIEPGDYEPAKLKGKIFEKQENY